MLFRSVILHRTLKTIGVVEAHLAEKLGDVNKLLNGHPKTTLAFLPQVFSVRLRISVREVSQKLAEEQIRRAESNIRSKIGNYIYGIDDETIEEVVENLLRKNKYTLAVAESCTGGRITDKVTNVSGSSGVFERGIISYSNESKKIGRAHV